MSSYAPIVLFQVVELLLHNGGHIDAKNRAWQRPVDSLRAAPDCKINPLHFLTLKCLAARAVVEHGIDYTHQVPVMLEEFIQAH